MDESLKKLYDLGYTTDLKKFVVSNNLNDHEIGRVVKESKKFYCIKTNKGDYNGYISGKFRYDIKKQSSYPAVGDWVLIKYIEESKVQIIEILPRRTIIERQSIGKFGKKQTIATNVDVAFIMQDIAYDFNLNRLDRLLAICFTSKIHPQIIFTKIDLLKKIKLEDKIREVNKRFKKISVTAISNKNMIGFSDIQNLIEYGKTYCFIGASGAGKSTLINNLVGEQVMFTQSLRDKSNKGQHTTSHRELFILENSGILIDTPGMRELGIVDSNISLELTFETIFKIAQLCKFSDCMHLNEPGCEVLKALQNNKIDKNYYDNYLKMKEQQLYFEQSQKGIKNIHYIKKMKSDPNNKKTRR